MSESQRLSRARAKPDRTGSPGGHDASTAAPAYAGPAPQWAAGHVPAPFGLAGVQRKVTIGPAGDAYEREADRVAVDVASGRSIAPSAISPIGSLGAIGQRASASGKKPEQDKKPEPERKAEAEKKKKDDQPAGAPLQKAEAPAPPRKDEKKDAKKKDEKPAPAPVQKAAAPAAPAKDDKKKDEKKDEKKKDAKPAPAPVQKAAAPAAPAKDDKKKDQKKDDKPKGAAPVQKAPPAVQAPTTPKEKEKKENGEQSLEQKIGSAPVQREMAPAPAPGAKSTEKEKDKKKEEPKKAPLQKAAAAPAKDGKDKKKEEKPAAAPVQKTAAPVAAPAGKEKEKKPDEEKKKNEPPKPAPPVQMAAAPAPQDKDKDKKKDKTAPVQRAASDAPSPAMSSAADRAIQNRGAGEPMQSGTRRALESQMGVDLGGVRVHEGGAARESAQALQARAFTHGSDIWLGPGESQSNVPLMAHEATHVVQQAGGVHRMVLQRAKKGAADDGDWDFESKEGKIKKDTKLLIPTLKIPTFKKDFTPEPVTLPKKDPDVERNTKQIEEWEKAAGEGTKIEDKIEKKVKDAKSPAAKAGGEPIYFLELKDGGFYLIGTKKEIKQRVLRPFWDKAGKRGPFQVDHKLEYQLMEDPSKADAIDNLWLLEASANMASGRNIKSEKEGRIKDLLNAASKKKKKKGKDKAADEKKGDEKPGKAEPIFDKPPDVDKVRQTYTITFEKVQGGLEPKGTPKTWKLPDIKDDAAPIDALKVLTEEEIKKQKLQGTPDVLSIYTNETGGGLRQIKDWPGEKKAKKKANLYYGKNVFQVDEVEFDQDSKTGTIYGTAFAGNKLIKKAKLELPIKEMPAVEYGGAVSHAAVNEKMKKALELAGMSPIELDNVELTDRGFVGRGRVLPTIPLIKDIGIDLVLDGDDIYLSKVFTAGELKFPGPIKVTGASLEVYVGTKIGARGDVYFEIERVGQGKITAKGEVEEGFSIEGRFDFDSELFDPAFIEVWYKKEKFGGKGEIGIPAGKVKGIQSAKLTATIDGEKIDAAGTVKPSIPGIEQGDLKFSYDPATGVVIAGKLELKKDIPGLEGGSVSAELAKRPGDEKWKVKAAGEATPKVPGVSSKLSVTYDDGAFDAFVVAGYEKGMLKGSVTVGATNRPVGDDGKPAGPPPDKGDKVTLYGGGSVTLKIAPWLQATAGIKLLPNGEIEVTGEIGLPAALKIFDEKKLDKNIFKIGIDIPIVGVSVAGQRIGIFANISGGLDLSAGIGPGELNQLKLSVTYNPAHEENTLVTGDANLHIPAHAGLRLFVRGSLGVGIPIVSASAGIEIGGALGLEGALDAGVHVEWTPTKGLDLTAQASVYVEPKLKFDITGFVLVEADLLFTTIELYSKRWQLAAFEYGSGLRFGLKFPIHYQEGKAFDISLSDVEFEVPKIEPGSLLGDLVKKIA